MSTVEPLAGDEVHLWLLDARLPFTDAELEAYRALLSPAEASRLSRLAQAPRRREFLLCRALLRTTLSRYADVAPGRWDLDATLAAPAAPPVSGIAFGIASAQALVACAVSRTGVGLVVEWLGRRVHAVQAAPRWLSHGASSELLATVEPQRRDRFFDLWTAERAHARAHGTRTPPHRTPPELRAAPNGVCIAGPAEAGADCRAFLLSPTSENRVAVVARGAPSRLVTRWTIPLGLTPGTPPPDLPRHPWEKGRLPLASA